MTSTNLFRKLVFNLATLILLVDKIVGDVSKILHQPRSFCFRQSINTVLSKRCYVLFDFLSFYWWLLQPEIAQT